MPKVEKVSLALTAEMATAVREAVHSGESASNSEVVREALRQRNLQRALHDREVDELRGLWDEGIASDPGQFDDMAALKAEARRRLVALDDL